MGTVYSSYAEFVEVLRNFAGIGYRKYNLFAAAEKLLTPCREAGGFVETGADRWEVLDACPAIVCRVTNLTGVRGYVSTFDIVINCKLVASGQYYRREDGSYILRVRDFETRALLNEVMTDSVPDHNAIIGAYLSALAF